jgi:hypothetical protein
VTTTEFCTEDLQLSAFLLALGFTPRVAGPADRRQFIFPALVAHRVSEYYQTPCPCSAKDLFRHYRSLRGRMFREPAQLH